MSLKNLKKKFTLSFKNKLKKYKILNLNLNNFKKICRRQFLMELKKLLEKILKMINKFSLLRKKML